MEYRVKEVIFEEIKEDGSVGREETLTEHGWDLGKIRFCISDDDPTHCFWIASSHSGLTAGAHAIATAVPGQPLDEEAVRDRTNTLIGLIRDRACHVFASYDVGKTVITK